MHDLEAANPIHNLKILSQILNATRLVFLDRLLEMHTFLGEQPRHRDFVAIHREALDVQIPLGNVMAPVPLLLADQLRHVGGVVS